MSAFSLTLNWCILDVILFMSALGHLYLLVSYIYQGDIFILNHLGLEHLSGVKGGCPLEEAYYLKLSLFKALSTFSEMQRCQ
jgi:hypothetical protein